MVSVLPWDIVLGGEPAVSHILAPNIGKVITSHTDYVISWSSAITEAEGVTRELQTRN